MNFTLEQLMTQTDDQVRSIALSLNIKPHPRAKKETIARQIIQQPSAQQSEAMKHVAELPQAAPDMNTPEQVTAAIAKYAKEGFEVKFLDNNSTWNFKYKGAEDSGHMSTKLRLIVQRAEYVSKGRRAVIGHNTSEFDRGLYKGYADTVLAG